MSDDDADRDHHPRARSVLFGHEAGEQALLQAYRSGRIPHAWLIAGPPGIGKATLAFRMARFVLAHPDPAAPAIQTAQSLEVAQTHPVAELIRAQSHPDLLILERMPGDTGKLRSVIRVDDARRVAGFLGATAGFGGWRVVIVDSVDDLNAESANALLKGLEEPPARTLFLLVSNAPASVLPTIRSRCHRLALRPLEPAQLAQAVASVTGVPPSPDIVAAAEGSVGKAMTLLEGPALKLRQQTERLLAQLPHAEQRELHALSDALSSDAANFAIVLNVVNDWLSERLRALAAEPSRAVQVADLWGEVNAAARTADVYNLDRKPLIFKTFGRLAEIAAG
jgi:DNA polymerase III subunit delta'